MQLPTSSRREVVEELLDIKIFSSMNSLIKEKIRGHKEQIRTFELKKESLKDKIEMQERFIREIENNGKSDIKNKETKIGTLLSEENDFMNDNIKLMEELNEFENQLKNYTGASEKLKKLCDIKGKLSHKVSSITKEHKFFSENVSCPTCTQSIEEEFRINKIEDAQNKAKELQSGFKELEQAINKEEERERLFTSLTKEISTLTHGISKNNTQIAGCQRQIRDLESEIQRITEQLANRNTEHDKLAELKENLKNTYDKLVEKKEDVFYHDFTYSLLKDGGVKSKIINKYLPLINQQVNKYLQMMDFYINFKLDGEFNETIQSPIHEDFSYSSFSEGEKMRIDLALLFTWREVARFKNSVNTNLMILDEICDSSLDGTGNDEFLKIIRYKQPNANVFVISHKEGLEDKFDKVLRFEKVKGFSRLSP
jgi:DNA repair exonuclease SbcCD ATPase subunit